LHILVHIEIVIVVVALAMGRMGRFVMMNNFYLAGSQNLVRRLEEIASLLRAGKKINAIKVYCEVTGASLAEAKDAVERLDMAIRMYGTMVVADTLMEVAQQGMQMDMDVQSIVPKNLIKYGGDS
jgi:hypothetical protein